MKRKILCLLLGALMMVSSPLCVLADQESDIAAQKEASSDELDSTMNQIESSVSAQSSLQQEISDLDTQLITLMSDIDILTLDIESTESQIDEKTAELLKLFVKEQCCGFLYKDSDGAWRVTAYPAVHLHAPLIISYNLKRTQCASISSISAW